MSSVHRVGSLPTDLSAREPESSDYIFIYLFILVTNIYVSTNSVLGIAYSYHTYETYHII